MGASFNLFSEEFRADPYASYRALIEHDRVHYNESLEAWVVAGYDEASFVLRDPRFSAARVIRGPDGTLVHQFTSSMVFTDPPDHTRLRNLVSRAFTTRAVDDMRPRIQRIVDDLLDRVGGRMDVIADFAYPLPVTVIADMLGVPVSDHERFRAWTRDIALSLDHIKDEPAPEAIERRRELAAYFLDLLAERRAKPRDDLLSGLVRARDRDDRLNDQELLATAVLLLVAGHETTVNLIGSGLLALLRHPGELDRLRAEPRIGRAGVEELLRFDGPVQLTRRNATADVEVGGHTIRTGDAVVALLGAAGRDPRAFECPAELDLRRVPNNHIGFGAGIHFCLGAPLARLEARIALETLLRRFPRIAATGDAPAWRETVVLRGLESLPVTLD